MGLKKSDVLKDPVVQETIKALEAIGCAAPTEADLDRPPMLRILFETDNLDSETAAILIAGKMTRGKFPEDYMTVLREDLTSTLWILQDPENKENPARVYEQLLEEGSTPAIRIAMAAVTARGTGPEFEALKSGMSQSELVQHANEIAETATQLLSQVGDNLRWQPQAKPAVEALADAATNLSQLADNTHAREFRNIVREFKKQAGIKDEPKLETPKVIVDDMRVSTRATPMTMSTSDGRKSMPKPAGGLTAENMMDDPLVQETVKALEEAGYSSGGGRGGRGRMRDMEHPALAMLADMGALDSVTAAVLVAESIASGSASPEELADIVPAQVGEVLRLLGDSGGLLAGAAFSSGNIPATKLGMATLAEMLTGPELRELERADPREKQMAMMQIGAIGFTAVDIADAMKEHSLFDKMPAPLVERFAEGLENLASLSDSKSMKRFFTEASNGLKEGMLKANSKDLTEPKPPEGPAPGAGPAPDAPKGPSSGSFKF